MATSTTTITLTPKASSKIRLGGKMDVREHINQLRQQRTPYSDSLARSQEVHQEYLDSLNGSISDIINYLDFLSLQVPSTVPDDGGVSLDGTPVTY